MNDDQNQPKQKAPPKAKKLNTLKVDGLLLTPGSSRRKQAWKRLRASGTDRGMTQDQVSGYLESHMKKHYQKVRKEGALTFDKVQGYLNYLAKLASKSLPQSAMDPPKVASFAMKIESVVEKVGSMDAITGDDINEHADEIRQKAAQHLKELEQSPVKNNPDQLTPVEKTLVASDETPERQEPAPDTRSPDLLDIMTRELIPIGFESGAPRISANDFFRLPLGQNELEADLEQPFVLHLRYLDLAFSHSCLTIEDLDQIKQNLTTLAPVHYRKYFNIFPDGEYDDAQMMIVYSQWRNQSLNRFLIQE